MRPIPRHWATVRESVTFPSGQEWALTIHGASDLSVEEAQRDARERLRRVVEAGGPQRGRTAGWSTTLCGACPRSCSRSSALPTAR